MEKAVFDSLNSGLTVSAVAYAKLKEAGVKAYDELMSGAGQATAKMIVEGKNFGDSMEQVFKNILENFIAMVAEMILRWAAAQALMSAFGPASSLGSFVAAHATGADYMVDRPTLFMAGDNGPERVRVAPITGTDGGGSTSNTNSMSVVINMTNNVANNVDVDKIGERIIYAIRARGQLNFSRA
jgi:hypothetical protein